MGAKLLVGAAAVGGALALGGWWLLQPGTGPQALAETENTALAAPQELSGEEITPLHEPTVDEGRAVLAASEPREQTDSAATPPAWSLSLELRGWSEEDEGPLRLDVRRGAEAEPCLSEAHALASELELDLGELFAGAPARPDQLSVRLDHPAYLPANVEVLVSQELLDPAVDSGRLQAVVDLVRAKAIVTGTVEVPEVETDAQVRVAIFALRSDRPESEPIEIVRPNAEGRFRLRADDAEHHAVVALDDRTRTRFVVLPGQGGEPVLRPDTRVLTLTRGEERDIGALALGKGESIQGRVVRAGGSLPASGQVRAGLQGQGRFLWGEMAWVQERFELFAQTADWGEGGTFCVPGLAPHAYVLTAWPGDFVERNISMSYHSGADDQVVVTAPGVDVLLTLNRVCVTIEVLGEGLPLVGTALCLFLENEGEMTTFTDEEGRARLELDSRRGLHVEARDARYGSKELQLSADELLASDHFVIGFEGPPIQTAELVLMPAASDPALLDGLLLDLALYETSRTPAEQLDYARRRAPGFSGGRESVLLNPSGPRPELNREGANWVVSGIPPGNYLVRIVPRAAEPDGSCFVLSELVELKLESGERNVQTWRPRLGGKVRLNFTGTGSVRRAELLNRDEVRVETDFLSAGPAPGTRASRGLPQVPGINEVRAALPPGDYLLRIHMRDRTTRTIPIQVEAGRMTDVEVDLGEL